MAEKEVKTWDDIRAFDDILHPSEIDIIDELEEQNLATCPYLRNVGRWYFCGVGLAGEIDEKPRQDNPAYQKHVDCSELQLFCMGDFERCAYKRGNRR